MRNIPFQFKTPTRNISDAMSGAGIDFQVAAQPLQGFANGDKFVTVYRTDTREVLGQFKSSYNIIHNSTVGELAADILHLLPEATIVGGGYRNNGGTVFLQIDLGRSIDLGSGDVVVRYLMIATSHDGGTFFIKPYNVRFSCFNQWTAMMRNPHIVKVTHTMTADQRIVVARHSVAAAIKFEEQWNVEFERLLNTELAAYDVSSIFGNIAGPVPTVEGRAMTERDKRLDALWDEYRADFNHDLQGTAMGVLMAAQGVDEHGGRQTRKKDEQRVARLMDDKYPLASKALTLVS